ncbi:MAG: cation transporter, partial [Gammaproteobacteria bacterium]|nr:cation transporter [Gammaproteobacteria bacterium]
MTGCCDDTGCGLTATDRRQARTLRRVLAINVSMFGVEFIAGLLAASVALLGDSLDMLGDALVYGVSLAVVGGSVPRRAGAALFKAAAMLGFGGFVLAESVRRMLVPALPDFGVMATVGLLALAANAFCLALLWRHREEDINMRSVWLCSRNDVVANVGVLTAAALVAVTGAPWPDLLIGLTIAALFLRSAIDVTRDAMRQIRAPV